MRSLSIPATAAAFALALLCGCGSRGEHAAASSSPLAAANAGLYDREKILNVYNWIDYIAPDTVADFEKETGIQVRYDAFDNNEVLETKLLTGHTNYDVVYPTENYFDRQLRAGVYRKIDKEAVPNLKNADPQIMRRVAVHDPGNSYAVPYMWSTTGLGYNVDKVRARLGPAIPDSWALLFDVHNAEKLKDCPYRCVLGVLAPRDPRMDAVSHGRVTQRAGFAAMMSPSRSGPPASRVRCGYLGPP
jgi:spermidine/putrescine-binding protein